MKDWIRRHLDRFEDRQERRDEEFAALLIRGVDAMAHRPTLRLFIYILGGMNIMYWASVLLFPFDILDALKRVSDLSDKMGFITISMVFGTGMWLTYALFRLKFPNLEDADVPKGFMSAFERQEKSHRRFRIWIISVAGGVANLLALTITELIRLGDWRRP